MEEQKNTRGGARPGAGRPKGINRPYKAFSVKLPVEYIEKIKEAADSHGMSISRFIQEAVDSYQTAIRCQAKLDS